MTAAASSSSSSPMLFSVLSSPHDGADDLVHQLRNRLMQIEANVQQTLNKIRQRQPFTLLTSNTTTIDDKNRKNFLHVLQDVATKHNLPFDESLFRRQVLENNTSSPSPKVDVVRAKPSLIHDVHDAHLSPVNNARRSQFAPVLSSTPVHQTSPIMPISVDLTMATPSVAPAFTMNSTDLSAAPPSAIVPQRANLARAGANRPPRLPRGESATRQKKNPSPIREQPAEDATVVIEEIRLTSKRRIQTKQEIVEDNVRVIIEQRSEISTDMIKSVQATPLRGRKKKIVQEEPEPIPQLEPPPPPPPAVEEEEVRPKTARVARGKKKGEVAAPVVTSQPMRASSLRNRKKPAEIRQVTPSPPKKATRNRKKTDNPTEESAPVAKVRATPMRGKKKSPPEPAEPVIPLSPKKATARSKKRKGNEDQQENLVDAIQPPSPKRRGGRKVKSTDLAPAATMITPPAKEEEQQPVAPTRSSRRGKKDVELPVEKQDDIVLNKKPRAARGKKLTELLQSDVPVTIVDMVTTSVTVSASIPSSISLDSIVAKPPRPPVARKKKSIAMPPISQMSPTTPPSSSQRIQSTSPINDRPLLPIPVVSRRRQPKRRDATSPTPMDAVLEVLPSANRNQKRTRSSVATTPKRARRENLVVVSVPGTPGKKRNKCTCEKRRNGKCDICASAIDV